MPDFGAPVAGNNSPQDALTSLSGVMNIARTGQALQSGQIGIQQQQQNLQTGAYKQQQEQGAGQLAQQQMQERQLLQQALKSGKDDQGNPLFDPQGEINTPAMAKFVGRALPATGQQYLQSIIQTQDNRIKLNDSVRTLGDNFRNDISGVIRSSIGTADGPDQIGAKLDAYAKANPQSADALGVPISRAKALLGTIHPQSPQDQRDKALLHLAQEFQPSGTTQQEQTPKISTYTTPGGDRGTTQDNPFAPGGMGATGPVVKQGTPPTVVSMPTGLPATYKGGGVSGGGANGAGGPQATSQDMASFGDYQANLNNRVRTASDLIPRIQQAEAALSNIKAGGGTAAYAAFARTLQAAGVPQSLVDKVAGGSLADAQEAEKYLFQTTFAGLKQSMGGDSSRVAEFQAAEQVFPSIGTDPKATKSVLNFMRDQASRDYAEQQALNTARKNGTLNPATWQGEYQQQLRAGKVPGVPQSQIPNASGGSATPGGAPQAGGKVVSMADVEGYAKKHSLSVDAAKQHILNNGFQIK